MSFLHLYRGGRVFAEGSSTIKTTIMGDYAVNIRVPDLRMVEKVLEYSFHCEPIVDPGSPTNEKISGNVVGVTLVGVGDGTTLTVTVLAAGV